MAAVNMLEAGVDDRCAQATSEQEVPQKKVVEMLLAMSMLVAPQQRNAGILAAVPSVAEAVQGLVKEDELAQKTHIVEELRMVVQGLVKDDEPAQRTHIVGELQMVVLGHETELPAK
jgi:hypothetical protein